MTDDAGARQVDEFLASVSGEARAALEELRSVIRAAAPDAVEAVAYGVPAFRYGGRPLVSYGAGKAHCSFYVQSPEVMEAEADALHGYRTSKGTVHFRPDGPLPVELVRLEQNQGPGAAFREGFRSALRCAGPDALVVTLEADTTSDLGALPQMLAEVQSGADVVLADWRMVGVSAHRRLLSAGAGWVVRHALGLQATTVSSFFRVYRASTLREASARYGDKLIRERGFACKAELLAKLTAMSAQIVEVPVALDWSRRNGESKMPVFKTMLAYWRMLFRQRGEAAEPLPAATEGALGA